MRRHNFSCEMFAQENGSKNTKYAVKWMKTGKKLRKIKQIHEFFQFAHTNIKILRKVIKILHRRTTVRR